MQLLSFKGAVGLIIMGYDIYINKKKAESIGIVVKKVGEREIPQWEIDIDGWEIPLPSIYVPQYEVSVNGQKAYFTNFGIGFSDDTGEEYISWRSSSLSNPDKGDNVPYEWDSEPSFLVKEKLSYGVDYTESY